MSNLIRDGKSYVVLDEQCKDRSCLRLGVWQERGRMNSDGKVIDAYNRRLCLIGGVHYFR